MNFTWNDRFVANGSTTSIKSASTYARVLSRETINIAFTYAALNGLNIMADDIHNAYLQAPISEKYCNIPGPEFKPEL